MVYAMIGLPARHFMFLPGIRFEPPRAGIIAMAERAVVKVCLSVVSAVNAGGESAHKYGVEETV